MVKKKKAFCTMFKRTETEKNLYNMAKNYESMQNKIAELESKLASMDTETKKSTRSKKTNVVEE